MGFVSTAVVDHPSRSSNQSINHGSLKINQALQMSILQSSTLLTPMHLQTSRKMMSILSKDCVVQDNLEISLHQKLHLSSRTWYRNSVRSL
nr:MAG TPA: hypothetical protein [Caudoviricetes sp.]